MAKVAQAEPLALEALLRLLGDPAPRPLHGSKALPGIFPGAAAGEKAAARYCLDHGWLMATGATTGKGKSRKELYRLASAGLQAAIAKLDARDLLEGLAASVARLDEQAAHVPQAAEQASMRVAEQLAELTATVKQELTDSLRPLGALPAALHELKAALAAALDRVKPIDVDDLTRKLAAPANTGQPTDDTAWRNAVVDMAAAQKQQNPFQRLTLPQVFDRLRQKFPDLTLGQFHDGLRRLVDEKRIRLGPFTQALATLDDARTALFLDREVKYYVELP